MANIQCPLNAAAYAWSDRPAIISGERMISYGEYEALVASTAFALKTRGVMPGQRVAIISKNDLGLLVLLLAIPRVGAVSFPISPRLPGQVLQSILKRVRASVVIDPENRLPRKGSSETGRIDPGSLFAAATSSTSTSGDEVTLDLDDEATIILTSGSTALPKAALHSWGNHYYNALGSNKNLPIEPGHGWLLSLPLYHVGGLGILFRTILGGGTLVLPEQGETIHAAVERYAVTHLSLVSTQVFRLLNQGLSDQAVGRLRALLLGGGPVSSTLITRAVNRGLPLCTTYGLTEMASQVTTTVPGDAGDRLFSSGKILEYRRLRIEDGAIFVKGRTLFRGYVEEQGIERPFDDKGWFKTGDMGRMDRKGYLTFLGRQDNMFISGGENIQPEEIEGALCAMLDITQAVVVPVEDEEFGFRPVAFVRTPSGVHLDQEDLICQLERDLPRFKIPEAFLPWPEEADERGLKPDRTYLTTLAGELQPTRLNK